MAVKTREELEVVLSTGGSNVTIERNLIKDLLDSIRLAAEQSNIDETALEARLSDIEDRLEALEAEPV